MCYLNQQVSILKIIFRIKIPYLLAYMKTNLFSKYTYNLDCWSPADFPQKIVELKVLGNF